MSAPLAPMANHICSNASGCSNSTSPTLSYLLTPHHGQEINRWALLLLMVFFVLFLQIVVQSVLFLWGRLRRISTDPDDIPDNTSTNLEDGSDSGSPTVWLYRDNIGPDIPITSTSGPPQVHPRSSDDPYVAGLSSLQSFHAAPHPDAIPPAPLPIVNVEEVQKLIAELRSLTNGPASADTAARVRLVQRRITELVIADPRYALVVPPVPLGPPPAYQDAVESVR